MGQGLELGLGHFERRMMAEGRLPGQVEEEGTELQQMRDGLSADEVLEGGAEVSITLIRPADQTRPLQSMDDLPPGLISLGQRQGSQRVAIAVGQVTPVILKVRLCLGHKATTPFYIPFCLPAFFAPQLDGVEGGYLQEQWVRAGQLQDALRRLRRQVKPGMGGQRFDQGPRFGFGVQAQVEIGEGVEEGRTESLGISVSQLQ